MVPNGQVRLRRFVQSWTISNGIDTSDLIERYRRMFRTRFHRESDWLRLVLLGGILITLSTLGVADGLQTFPGYFSGVSAIFGGVAIVLIVPRIARGDIYVDWMVNAILCILAGAALSSDENLAHISTLIYICVLLLACGAIRIWIGLTASPEDGAIWILSSGCVAALGALWIVFAWLLVVPRTAALILAFDTLFQGIAISGFGLSLRDTRRG